MKLPLIAGALAIAATTVAFANEPATTTSADPKATFQSLDVDGNGRISAEEARAHAELSAAFSSTVTDSSQGMTRAEFDAWAASRQPATTPPSN
jgi:hypothetical protein